MTVGYIFRGLGAFMFKIGAVIFLAVVLGVYVVLAIAATITGAALQKH
jgi:hypothetical protein